MNQVNQPSKQIPRRFSHHPEDVTVRSVAPIAATIAVMSPTTLTRFAVAVATADAKRKQDSEVRS